MALGGGTFITQNKILPGSYINFVSLSSGANVFGERGTAAIGISLDWGTEDIIELEEGEFMKNSLKYFTRAYTDEYLKDIREAFKYANKVLVYKLNQTSQVKAENKYCTAKGYGSRGNYIQVVISANADDESKYDVALKIYGETVFEQAKVQNTDELEENSYVEWKSGVEISQEEAGIYLAGGVMGFVDGTSVQKFLSKLESYSFNAVAIIYDSAEYERLLIEWTKRMRDEVGKKFQCVTAKVNGNYEGNVCVKAKIKDSEEDYHILAWTAGAICGCEINKSLTNTIYNGEYELDVDYTQSELEQSIEKGEFVFHRVNDSIRVLMDINSLTEFTVEKGEVFKANQTIRVIDQIANDIAEIFNDYYLGKVPNDDAGRTSFWSEIVKHHEKLAGLRAIENFSSEDITVEQGESKGSVVVTDCITPVNAMTHLYMTVIVE